MIEPAFNLQLFERALSRLIDQDVHLLLRTTSGGAPWYMVVPRGPKTLDSTFWLAVRNSESGGVWRTAEEALVGFAADAKHWMSSYQKLRPDQVAGELATMLTKGPASVAALNQHFGELGVSRDCLGRVARRMGVIRRKQGMRGGWVWIQPERGPPDLADQ